MAVSLELDRLEIEEQVEVNRGTEPTPSKDKPPANLSLPKKSAVNLTVFTFDDEKTFSMRQVDKNITAAAIVEKMSDWLNFSQIPDQPLVDVFSLWMVSASLDMQLKSGHKPIKLYKKWNQLLSQYTTATKEQCDNEKPKLYFRRNVFLSLDREKDIIQRKLSQEAITLLYYEAVHNVTKGRYPPLPKEEALELATYQCAVKYTKQNIEPGSMNISGFLPPYISMVSVTSSVTRTKPLEQLNGSGLERDFINAYNPRVERKDLRDKGEIDAFKCKYLEKCWTKDYYGSIMFCGLVEKKKTSNPLRFLVYKDRPVVVAINLSSIHILNTTNREVLLCLKLSHDLSCDFQPATEEGKNFYPSLWLEFNVPCVRDDYSERLQIFSRQALLMDTIINRRLEEIKKGQAPESRVTSCTESTKAFVCEKYRFDPKAGEKVRVKPLASILTSLTNNSV